MDLNEEHRMNVMPMMGLSIAMDNNCKIITQKFLEFLVTLTCIPWNFF